MKIITKAFPVDPAKAVRYAKAQFVCPMPLIGNTALFATFSILLEESDLANACFFPQKAWLIVTMIDSEKCAMMDEIKAWEEIDRTVQSAMRLYGTPPTPKPAKKAKKRKATRKPK